MALFSRNYNKPGPGVRKDEPQKKPFFRFFELYGRNFWKLVVGNLWTVLLSLPILTIGLAQAGMTYIARMVSLDRHVFSTSDYFETIKKNWKQALPIGIIDLLIAALLAFDFWFFSRTANGILSIIGIAITFFGAFIFALSGFYRYMLAISFKFKLFQVYKNSLMLAIGGLGKNMLCGLILIAVYALTFVLTFFTRGFGILILFLLITLIIPALRAYIIQFMCFPVVVKYMINPYYEAHPDEDIEKRRELGLLPYEDPDDGVDWGES